MHITIIVKKQLVKKRKKKEKDTTAQISMLGLSDLMQDCWL
jgi:hypothetical protein